MSVYYNELDAYAAQWLRNLMEADLIPDGDVDERDVRDVRSGDLAGYDQCHFFAGIGGWPLALRMAGWPDDEPVWTGSCPCQPFSTAGNRRGEHDERHLWPAWRRLLHGRADAEQTPPVIFGEQVASKDGRAWLAGVRADLEALGYAVGAADLSAAGAGAPHIRQRLWWVADAGCNGTELVRSERQRPPKGDEGEVQEREWLRAEYSAGGANGRLADAIPAGRSERRTISGDRQITGVRGIGGPGDPHDTGSQGRGLNAGEYSDQRSAGQAGVAGFWSDFDLIPCTDGKARRIEPGTFPLAHGVPARVGKLRAYGNAIVPQVAAEFIRAYIEASEAGVGSRSFELT